MAVTRSAAKTATAPARENPLNLFVWEGTDKRGVKMKGEQQSKNANFLRAELRKQGITPTVVKAKPKPLFGGGAKKISPRDIAVFSRQIATGSALGPSSCAVGLRISTLPSSTRPRPRRVAPSPGTCWRAGTQSRRGCPQAPPR